ncbi:hypothetical protein FNH22_03665 [Fulvivirga sp. M361]|uniref:hypothetical protein n=1 Tax=Fulvivirga sp. M361 TaxID=2594266 RepID=UPI00117BA7FF|nr:hypothetical protein [Fulvivirga sp. M361]TRX61881.1 hypothetical protein FNH22_03665 [Fulvivirga sp. M361]
MKNVIKLIVLFGCLSIYSSVISQTYKVSGRLLDYETKKPIDVYREFHFFSFDSLKQGFVANEDGYFELEYSHGKDTLSLFSLHQEYCQIVITGIDKGKIEDKELGTIYVFKNYKEYYKSTEGHFTRPIKILGVTIRKPRFINPLPKGVVDYNTKRISVRTDKQNYQVHLMDYIGYILYEDLIKE